VLPIPQHFQKLSSILGYLCYLTCHFCETSCYESLLILKFFYWGVSTFLDLLELFFKPYDKIFDLLLFR